MKSAKSIYLMVFSFMLIIVCFFSVYQESNNFLGCKIVSSARIEQLISHKSSKAVSSDLLMYGAQALPYQEDSNIFIIPYTEDTPLQSSLSSNYGKIYLSPLAEDNYAIYVINSDTYFEAKLTVSGSAIMLFNSTTFENHRFYGTMHLYMPNDSEIDGYSCKTSDAVLSYDPSLGLTTTTDRSYSLKLRKNGDKNKLKLANLRKDDDWELDSLLECDNQIFSFLQNWNAFCHNINKTEFLIYYQPVEFILNGNYMGTFLLRVPMDDKQLENFSGTFLSNADESSALFYSDINSLYQNSISDTSLQLSYYLWETTDGSLYCIPNRFYRIVPSELGN